MRGGGLSKDMILHVQIYKISSAVKIRNTVYMYISWYRRGFGVHLTHTAGINGVDRIGKYR